MAKKSLIRLKAGTTIGEPAAEDDRRYLEDCFIDHPAVAALTDLTSHQSILLGRTGAGKSAILLHLESRLENVSRIDPKEVAFQYIGNSAVIREVSLLGVNLHTLFEYLWTHILTLHITRECLGIRNRDGLFGMLNNLRYFVRRDLNREVAQRYLEKHADNFWLNVEQVSSEITDQISMTLANEVGLSTQAFKAKVESGNTWKDEQKRLFKYRAQEVVSQLQMRELKLSIDALAAAIDPSKPYYILIDDLDREWAGGEDTQYALIRALVESIKTFRRMPNVKIVVAMREDLYEATVRTTSDKHFQAEKQEGIIKRLEWTNSNLIHMIERRIDHLFRFQYKKQAVKLHDVLPDHIIQEPLRDFIVRHTLRRPRDVIAFINKVFAENEGEQLPLTARAITKVEPLYSRDRLRALEDEWRSCHPLIHAYLRSLQSLPSPSPIAALDEDRLLGLVMETSELKRRTVDDVEKIALTAYERGKELRFKKLASNLISCLYKIGAVGVKRSATEAYTFSFEHRTLFSSSDVPDDAKFVVHPMLITALGCHEAKKDAA
jgi:hypothetical protein